MAAGYSQSFAPEPPPSGWPGWSSSEWTGGALGEFDMNETITFRLGELQKHSHLSIPAPGVDFHLGDDLEVGKRFTITASVTRHSTHHDKPAPRL